MRLLLEHVSKTFQSGGEVLTVLRDVNVSLDEGESVTVTGESGSGKSTLLNIIGGLDKASGGRVFAGEDELSGMSENQISTYRNRFVGFIFQFHYLLKDFTALENVMLPLLMQGTSRREAASRALDLLSEVGLENRSEHLPPRLSGGERQRTAVARSLINSPRFVLADEPTGNLDERNSRMVEEILFTAVAKRNTGLILVTHDSELAGKGGRCFTLEYGELREV
jgi:lipoprotein-releasing system ATP-binding protein